MNHPRIKSTQPKGYAGELARWRNQLSIRIWLDSWFLPLWCGSETTVSFVWPLERGRVRPSQSFGILSRSHGALGWQSTHDVLPSPPLVWALRWLPLSRPTSKQLLVGRVLASEPLSARTGTPSAARRFLHTYHPSWIWLFYEVVVPSIVSARPI